ncbi:MAG TPA: hypothetical protein VKB62_13485 [Streptosporangiaceae bacterium]|nr:hypothetical protein [Streptosporangiaceae bacterium]
MVRLLEAHGIIVTLVPFAGDATATISAFSTSQLPRPIVVMTPHRADDVYKHRFTAAREVGHLLLHGDRVRCHAGQGSGSRRGRVLDTG